MLHEDDDPMFLKPTTEEQAEYAEGHKHWWNDGDKVAGLLTTIFMVTFSLIVCLALIKLALVVLF